MNYTGTLLDGKVFDEGKLWFAIGSGDVIKCWEQAATQLALGQKAKLVCPPDMAYGN